MNYLVGESPQAKEDKKRRVRVVELCHFGLLLTKFTLRRKSSRNLRRHKAKQASSHRVRAHLRPSLPRQQRALCLWIFRQ